MHPILFTVGHFTVYTYGLFTALAMLAAFWVSMARASRFGFAPSFISDTITLCCVVGIFFGRAFFVLQNLSLFEDRPLAAFALWEGGLVWYGGFIGAAVSLGVWAKYKKQPVLALADLLAPALALAHGLGRVGCFFNGCCGGRLMWGAVQPVQLYEAGGLFLLAAILFYRPSFQFYILGYGCLRFFLEFLRAGQPLYGGLTLPQWISLGLIIGAILWKPFKSISRLS